MKTNLKATAIVIVGLIISVLAPNFITSNMTKKASLEPVESVKTNTQTKSDTVALAEKRDTAVPIKVVKPVAIKTETPKKEEEKKEEPKKEEIKEEVKEEKKQEEKKEEAPKTEQPTTEQTQQPAQEEKKESTTTVAWKPDPDGSKLTKRSGVNYYFKQKETYYNLNMSRVVQNAHRKGISGDYWVREDGCKMLGDYIMVAANLKTHPRGSIVQTSLGLGIVVDTGGFAASNPTQIDIATNW